MQIKVTSGFRVSDHGLNKTDSIDKAPFGQTERGLRCFYMRPYGREVATWKAIGLLSYRLLGAEHLANNVALSMATAEGKAGQIHGIVGAAEEVAGTIADRIQALDRIAILIKHLHLAIDVHAMDDGRQANVTMDAVEGGLLDRLQPLGGLAHIFVNTGIDELIVASNRLHERVHVSKAKLLAEFLDGVRLESRKS